MHRYSKTRPKGFTLLEILVALAVVAIGTAAVLQSVGSTVRSLDIAQSRVMATWVASNRIAELRLARIWPAAGSVDRSEVSGGRTWHYRESVKTTADEDVLRIDIVVYDDATHSNKNAEVFAYLTRYTPPQVATTQ